MSGYKVGDEVAWTSQSAGFRTLKVGRVVQVVPQRGDPEGVRNPGTWRDHESYVVRVKGRGLYWPRVSLLRPAVTP